MPLGQCLPTVHLPLSVSEHHTVLLNQSINLELEVLKLHATFSRFALLFSNAGRILYQNLVPMRRYRV